MNKPVLPVSVLTAWAAILDDIAKAAIVGIGIVIWSQGYDKGIKMMVIAGLLMLVIIMIYSAYCIRSYLSELEN